MLEIIVAQTEAQIQQVREISREYIGWLSELEKAQGYYDPEFYAAYG